MKEEVLTLVVVGANGYVGRSLLKEASCLSNISLHAQARSKLDFFDASNINMHMGSLEQINPKLFPDAPHVLIHVAGKNIDHDGSGYHKINVEGTANLLSHCNHNTIGIIYNSSLSVLGQGAQRNISNIAPHAPTTPLAQARAEAETLIIEKAKSLGIFCYCLRPRFVLGKDDAFVLPGLRKLVAEGLYIGDGSQQFSVIDVNDYSKVMLELSTHIALSDKPEQMALNIGYQLPLSFSSIYEILLNLEPSNSSMRKLYKPSALAWALSLLPIKKLRAIATQLQLIGLDHYGDIGETRKRLQTDLLSRDSNVYFRELVQSIKDSPCN